MAVNTSTDVTLSFTVDTVEYGCQLRNGATLQRPWAGEGRTFVTACGEQLSEPPDTPADGQIRGDVLADYSATGVTVGMDAALGQEVDIVWTEQVSGDRQRVWTGRGLVQPITRTWNAGRLSGHDLVISLVSEASNVYEDVV